MKIRFIISIITLSCLFACNQSATKQKTSSPDSLIKPANNLLDTLVKDNIDDTDYTNWHLTVSISQWQYLKSSYHLLEKNVHAKYNNKSLSPVLITGDFNGDKKTDTMFLVSPILKDTLSALGSQQCIGGCDSYILFSDTALQVLRVQYNLGGEIENVGDLDGDGADDVLVYPDWWQSNWNPYKVFSYNLQTKKWNYLIEPVSVFENDMEGKKNLVKKSAHKGFVSAFTSTSDIDGNVKSNYKDFKIIKGN